MSAETVKETDVLPLLSQILDELQAIRGLLERQVEGRVAIKTSETACRGAAATLTASVKPAYTTKHAQEYLERYLTSQEVRILEAMELKPENPVMRERMHLGYFVGQRYAVVRPLWQKLRATLQRPRPICFDLSEKSPEARSIWTNVADRLYKSHMLELYKYERKARVIRLEVSRQPFAHNYLSGGWFEYYVARATQDILRDRALLALRNVKLAAAGGAVCEVDVLLVTEYRGDLSLAVLECKSADTLHTEDVRQIRRRNELLNLGMQRSAVVLPETPSYEFAERWSQATGSVVIGREQLAQFLRGS